MSCNFDHQVSGKWIASRRTVINIYTAVTISITTVRLKLEYEGYVPVNPIPTLFSFSFPSSLPSFPSPEAPGWAHLLFFYRCTRWLVGWSSISCLFCRSGILLHFLVLLSCSSGLHSLCCWPALSLLFCSRL